MSEKEKNGKPYDNQAKSGSEKQSGMNLSSPEEKGSNNLKKQTEKVNRLKDGLDNHHTGPGDPKAAQEGLI